MAFEFALIPVGDKMRPAFGIVLRFLRFERHYPYMAPRQTPAERTRIPALGMISPPPIHVETPTFDGSLATLFACVRDRKVDLLDVPLFPICEAYFAYLINSEGHNLDEAAAALAALAYLLERKAWLLLPVVEEPDLEFEDALPLADPTAYEYHVAMETLMEWHRDRSRLFFRPSEAGPALYELPVQLANVEVADLARAFERMLERAQPAEPRPLGKERRSLDEQMKRVLAVISNEWMSLDRLIAEPFTRTDLVYWFLALLELMRLGQVIAKVESEEVEFARVQPILRLGEAA